MGIKIERKDETGERYWEWVTSVIITQLLMSASYVISCLFRYRI